MSARSNDFKIGLFVLIGIFLLLGGLFFFGASRLFKGSITMETYVAGDLGGLKTGTQVTLRGVPVGEVTGINFSWNVYHVAQPRYVVIEFAVHNNVSPAPPGRGFARAMEKEVREGLRARIKSQGLAGAEVLALEYVENPAQYPPLPFTWKPHHIYIPSAPGQFSEIISSVDATLRHVREVDFARMSKGIDASLAAVDSVLNQVKNANIPTMSSNINDLVLELRGQVERANIPTMSSNINDLVLELRGLSGRLQQFVGRPLAPDEGNTLQGLLANANGVLTQLKTAISRLNTMEGNLDTASLNQIIENIQRASASLEQVAHNLKEYPSGVLFGKPPPPAKSVETPQK